MAGIYKPKTTEGAAGGFNPKCNQTSGAQFASPSIPSAAEVAEEVMRMRAAERASQEAYKRAKQAQKRRAQNDPKRWLSHGDLE